MSFRAFLKDKFLLLVLHFVCMMTLYGFLCITDYSRTNSGIVLGAWLMILGVYMSAAYIQRSAYFRRMGRILEQVEQRYLLGELMPSSYHLEDRLYQEMIRKSNRSVIERMNRMDDRRREYKEYIESWVHEMKAPITGISLICENGKRTPEKQLFRRIETENLRIENDVDMVLYYARSENVYKDYLIRETNLEEVVCEVLKKNRNLLISNGIFAETACEESVYTDRKWLGFILNQILLNSVKYRREEGPRISIFTKREEKYVVLFICDNGAGIRPEELGRIFEKGFTGSNGRHIGGATGIGLYLCRELCGQLGIGISAESEYGRGTSIKLKFPFSRHITDVRDNIVNVSDFMSCH